VHLSDSSEQRRAEPLILEQVSAHVGKALAKRVVTLPGGARVEIDGVAEDDSVFAEVFAHLGALKGGQRHKPGADALKLITLARQYPNARIIIAFADAVAARYLTGSGWRAEAMRTWNVEVFVATLDDAVRDGIHAAQLRTEDDQRRRRRVAPGVRVIAHQADWGLERFHGRATFATRIRTVGLVAQKSPG
jgi:hypothetical protein